MSTFALPREKPSRKPAELSLTRLRKPASLEASRVRWLRSYRALGGVSVAVVDQVGLEPDDRLDPGRLARLVVLDRAVHHAVVGEAERGHVELGGAGGERHRSCRRRRAASTRCGRADGPLRRSPVDHAKRSRSTRRSGQETASSCVTFPLRGCGLRFAPLIWLLRHGDAEDGAGKPDAERDLTEKGERQSRDAGKALKALGVQLDVCLTSPKVRAQADRRARLRRTRRAGRGGRPAGRRRLRPAGAGRGPRRGDAGRPRARLLPAVALATGSRVKMKKGGIAAIDDHLLHALLRPKDLKRIAAD